ncbi:phosphatidylglycerol lysyltransferase domain-containing protein [Streptomyces zhihengii]|uniref:DUF2156 domain-containing protein n=1 Tax=Streptomyces zhihengii TaxID=1818004 RepID=A0ABS2UTH9_9ACTN|nr:DUF2156 domain-containing protein [Streptomyces zhihengii]
MSATVDGDTTPSTPYGAARPVRRILRGPRPGALPGPAGAACAAVGLLDVAAGTLPRFRPGSPHASGDLLPGALAPGAAALSLGAGVLLLLIAHGLGRRKRRAWCAAVVLLPAGAVAQAGYRHWTAGALLSLALLGVLVRRRGEFAAAPGPRSRWRALAAFVSLGAGSIALGLVIVGVHPRTAEGSAGLTDRLEHVMYGLFGVEGPLSYAGGDAGTVAWTLGTLGLLTAATTGYLALRPAEPAARAAPGEKERLRALLRAHGGPDAPGHRPARSTTGVVFSPSGRAAVRYRAAAGVMLACGDPVGEKAAWPGAIERFMDEARALSRTPAVTGCSPAGAEVWARETGLDPWEGDGGGDGDGNDAAAGSPAGRVGRAGRGARGGSRRAGIRTEDPRLET